VAGQKGWARARIKMRKRWDNGAVWDSEPRSEVIPTVDAEFCAGLGQHEEGVAIVATEIAAGAA
jgi:hypothetical protein